MLNVAVSRAGGSYSIFAGKEVARALAKMTLDPKDCCAKLDDLSPEQLKVLEDWEVKLKAKYPTVGKVRLPHMGACAAASPFGVAQSTGFLGQVVEPLKLTIEELAAYSGADKSKPILLAIRGVIFDVSRGGHSYRTQLAARLANNHASA